MHPILHYDYLGSVQGATGASPWAPWDGGDANTEVARGTKMDWPCNLESCRLRVPAEILSIK